jgi:hypothetical protein
MSVHRGQQVRVIVPQPKVVAIIIIEIAAREPAVQEVPDPAATVKDPAVAVTAAQDQTAMVQVRVPGQRAAMGKDPVAAVTVVAQDLAVAAVTAAEQDPAAAVTAAEQDPAVAAVTAAEQDPVAAASAAEQDPVVVASAAEQDPVAAVTAAEQDPVAAVTAAARDRVEAATAADPVPEAVTAGHLTAEPRMVIITMPERPAHRAETGGKASLQKQQLRI